MSIIQYNGVLLLQNISLSLDLSSLESVKSVTPSYLLMWWLPAAAYILSDVNWLMYCLGLSDVNWLREMTHPALSTHTEDWSCILSYSTYYIVFLYYVYQVTMTKDRVYNTGYPSSSIYRNVMSAQSFSGMLITHVVPFHMIYHILITRASFICATMYQNM